MAARLVEAVAELPKVKVEVHNLPDAGNFAPTRSHSCVHLCFKDYPGAYVHANTHTYAVLAFTLPHHHDRTEGTRSPIRCCSDGRNMVSSPNLQQREGTGSPIHSMRHRFLSRGKACMHLSRPGILEKNAHRIQQLKRTSPASP